MTLKTITTIQSNTSNATTEVPELPKQVNAVTGKAYFGDKANRLREEGSYRRYSSNEWATMKQWNRAKQTIAKGEKGTLVLFYEPSQGQVVSEEPQAKRVFLFNRCQLESFKAVDCGDKAF